MRNGLAIAIILILAGFAQRGNSQPVVIPDQQVVNLASNAFYIEDVSGKFSIDSILQASRLNKLLPVKNDVVNFGVTNSAFWLKIALKNETSGEILLRVGNYALEDVQVYEQTARGVIVWQHSGSWQAIAARRFQRPDFLFSLAVPPGGAETVFLRVQHHRGTQFPLQVATLRAFDNVAADRDVIQGIYYGFMLLMVLYNLFLFFSLRDPAYVYYVAYILAMGLLNASINGYAFRYLWPSTPGINRYEDVLAAAAGISGILFADSFLNTRKNTPFFFRLFNVLLVGYFIILAVVLAGRFTLGSVLVEMISLVLVISFFAAAWQTLRSGYKPARFFLIAWTLLLISVVVFILKDFAVLPYNSLTVSAMQIGSAIEAVLLSMALANKIKVYKAEKEEAQLATVRSLEQNKKLITQQNLLLEHRVEERTAALQKANQELVQVLSNLKETQEQLIQREKMASLGELTAGIAHEIQNPLNFVNNFSEVNVELAGELQAEVQQLAVPDDQKKSLQELANDLIQNGEKIAFHGRRAESIVKGMLQHSRRSDGVKEPTDINALVDEYLRLSYHGLRAKDKAFNATIEKDFDETLGAVPAVPQDLGRVLLNLFNNAFYAVNEKRQKTVSPFQPLVQVATRQVPEGVRICVRDNGVGVPPAVKNKIFQPFFTTKPAGEGTGLGLSLSYDIITKEHGGSFTVESVEGEFAEFKITLPYAPVISKPS